MRHTKTLSRTSTKNWFFRIKDTDYTVCIEFVGSLVGRLVEDNLSVELTLATKNPKRKGFKKILYKSKFGDVCGMSIMDGQPYETIDKQCSVLKRLGIKVGDTYWMKGELKPN